MIRPTGVPPLPHGPAPRAVCLILAVLAFVGFGAVPLEAQGLASQELGRGYWHVFAAYALAWLVVMGWVVSIGRRLAEVERRLEE